MKRQQPVISERVYREVISRAEQGKVPLYPSVVRKKAIERYKTEKIAELKRAQEETERKIREEQIRREERRRRAEQQRQEQYRKAEEASKGRVHTGQWIKIEEGGKSVSVSDMAALSPSQAKALGFKWGTYKANPKTGTFEFVPLPTEPAEPEYYGLLKWKYESGYYKNVPQMEKLIKKEIEVGGKKYGIKAPAWASGFAKEYEAVARQIKEAYTKASEYAAKPSPSELKKTKKKSVPKPITKQDILQYQRLTTLAQHPEVQAYISKMQSLQGISEQLQTQGAELKRQTEAHNKLVTELNRTFEEYQKGGWTPEEIAKYNLLAGAVSGIEKELEPKLTKYEKRAKKLEKTLKQPKPKAVKEFETLSKLFMEQYSPKQISQMEKAMIVSFPAKKQPMPEVTFTGLGEYIKSTGRVPVFTIPEQSYRRPPTAIESLIEPIKRLTGHYPEKEKALSSTLSTYRKQQLGLAESLGIIHKEKGKRYIVVNNTKYYEGTKGFDEHLGEAIQSKVAIKPPPEVKRRQEAIREAERIKSEFMKTYGGKPGEPIILANPESQKAFERVRSAFEAIPKESATTKAYWEEARKIRQAQPQIEEINVLAKQATKQAKEMEQIQKERLFGIPYKIETLEEKHPFLKKFSPPVAQYAEVKTPEEFVRAIEKTYKWGGTGLTEQQRKVLGESYKKGERVYGTYRRVWGLPSKPFEWEKKAAQLSAGIKAGQIEELRAHPIKGAITVASFAALPPIFKGAKYLWGVRAGETVGMAAKFPRLTKYAPKSILGSLGAGYLGTVGYEAYKAPTLEKKGEILGKTSVELAQMSAGTYMGIKLPSTVFLRARGLKTRLTRKKIPLPQITTEELASGKKHLGKVPEGMTGSELVKHFKEMQYKYALPGEEFKHGVKVWRAAPVGYGEATTVRRGEFEMPGMYTAPYVVPYFLRTKPPKIDINLFGLEPAVSVPAPIPTYYRFTLSDVLRVPFHVRKTGIPSGASWFLGRGRTGRGYISIPFEYGKREAESVIAATTGLRRTRSEFYSTTPKGEAIPIEEMEVFKTRLPRVPVGFESGKYYVKRPRGTAIIETEKGIIVHKGEQGEGYILPGGEIDTTAIKALRGEIGRGETALEGTIREIYEELGLKASDAKHLFKVRGKGISLYSHGGRQHWYSKNIYDVFKIDAKGRLKPQKGEISDIKYYKPGMDIELSEDTERILRHYFKLKKQLETQPSKDVSKITKRIIKEKKRGKVKKGRPRSIEDILKEEQEYYAQFPKKMSLISPEYLGIKSIILSSAIPTKHYKKIYEHYTTKPLIGEQIIPPSFSYTSPTYQYQKYFVSHYPKLSYFEIGYRKITYPQIGYPKMPEISYPETGYLEPTYPKIPYPKMDYFKQTEIPYTKIKIPPVSPPYPPSLIPRHFISSKTKYKKHSKKYPYEWFERHPMPTLKTLFGSGITQKTGMAIMTQLIGETPKKKTMAKKKPSLSKRKYKAKPSSIPVGGTSMMTQLIGEIPKR